MPALLVDEGEGGLEVGGEGMEGDDKEEGETHRSTLEKGLCTGVLLLLPLVEAGVLGAGFPGLVADVGALRTAAAAGLDVVLGLGLDAEDDDDGDEEPKLSPERSLSERSCFGAFVGDFKGEELVVGATVTHLCESGCR